MAFDSQLIVRIDSENALAESGLGPKLNPASPRPAWCGPLFSGTSLSSLRFLISQSECRSPAGWSGPVSRLFHEGVVLGPLWEHQFTGLVLLVTSRSVEQNSRRALLTT